MTDQQQNQERLRPPVGSSDMEYLRFSAWEWCDRAVSGFGASPEYVAGIANGLVYALSMFGEDVDVHV